MDRKKLIVLAVILVLSLGAYVTEAIAQSVLTMCGSVGTGSYVLGNNISTTGTCFTLTGNDITIDLDGFTIDGDDVGSTDFGITSGATGRQNIVIRNGTIKDFSIAVDMGNCHGSMVVGILAVSNTGDGIRIGPDCHVSHNIANLNGSVGIIHANYCTISYNIANNNGNSGISSDFFTSNIIYNTANNNAIFGINVNCPSNLVGNIADNNAVANLNQTGAGCKRYENLF